MKYRRLLSIISALIFLFIAGYYYLKTGEYTSIILWILICPLALSLHPVFYKTPEELDVTKKEHQRRKQIFNFVRFTIFGFGLLLFFFQIYQDLN